MEYVSKKLNNLAKIVNHEKLKAIGQRMKGEREEGNIQTQKQFLHEQIAEKQEELDRYQSHLDSLKAIEAQQINELEIFKTH